MKPFSGEEMLSLITSRQSDRSYSDRPVEREKVERLVEAARLSPSACNAQPWKFIVVDERDMVAQIAAAASARALGMNRFVSEVPLFIAIVRERANFTSIIGSKIKEKDYSLMDIGIASAMITLQAAAEGLGSCILGWFNEKEVKSILGVPRSKRIELLIAVGYPAKEQRQKKRKPHAEVISFNGYNL